MVLSDRVAVMRSGRLQQIGPPMEVYRRPANLFVAGFIGSPAMNFLEGELAARGRAAAVARSAGRTLDLPLDTVDAREPGGLGRPRKAVLGIRPTDLAVGGGQELTLRGRGVPGRADRPGVLRRRRRRRHRGQGHLRPGRAPRPWARGSTLGCAAARVHCSTRADRAAALSEARERGDAMNDALGLAALSARSGRRADPRRGRWPSASIVGVQGVLAMRLHGGMGEDRPATSSSGAVDAAAARWLRSTRPAGSRWSSGSRPPEPDLFKLVRNATYLAYYENPAVVRAIRGAGPALSGDAGRQGLSAAGFRSRAAIGRGTGAAPTSGPRT